MRFFLTESKSKLGVCKYVVASDEPTDIIANVNIFPKNLGVAEPIADEPPSEEEEDDDDDLEWMDW